MVLDLFTDADFAEADREISEATRVMMSGGMQVAATPLISCEDQNEVVDQYEIQLDEEELALALDFDDEQPYWADQADPEEVIDPTPLYTASGPYHAAWVLPIIALIGFIAAGLPAFDITAGLVLLPLISLNKKFGIVPTTTIWSIVAVHAFAMTRLATENVSAPTTEGLILISIGLVLGIVATTSLLSGSESDKTNDKSEPEFAEFSSL